MLKNIMVNANMNRLPGSPLGCCNPKEERQLVSPVFRQQYVNDNGKMKLTMPVSPIHYITSSGYYANDYRMAQLPQPWEMQSQPQQQQQVPYPQMYDPQMMHMEERRVAEQMYPKQMEPVSNKRTTTPNIHLMMQHRRQASVQLGKPEKGMAGLVPQQVAAQKTNSVNMTEVADALRRIEERLASLEGICKSNEAGLLKVLRTLLGTDRPIENKAEEHVVSDVSSVPVNNERLIIRNTENAVENIRANSSLSLGDGSIAGSKTVSGSLRTSKMLTQSDIPSITGESNNGSGTYGSTVFDVSQELRQSNDMLEKFLSNTGSLDGSNEGLLMQHENMKLSMLGNKQTMEIASEKMPALSDSQYARKSSHNATNTTLTVKPLVTTASMVTNERKNNRVIEDLEQRFQLMLNTLDNINNEARHISNQSMANQHEEQRAIGNSNDIEREQLSLDAPPANGASLALLKNGQMVLRNSAGELVPCEVPPTGDEIALMGKGELVTDGNSRNDSMALVPQGEMGMSPAAPTQEETKRLLEQYQADLAALKEMKQQGMEIEQIRENAVATQEYDEPETHKITCSIIPDNESDEEPMERLDSIRGLNTTVLD